MIHQGDTMNAEEISMILPVKKGNPVEERELALSDDILRQARLKDCLATGCISVWKS